MSELMYISPIQSLLQTGQLVAWFTTSSQRARKWARRSSMEWKDSEIEEGSELHRHLHKLLWGVEEFAEEEIEA